MTPDKSTLFINRLVIITHSGTIAYDEKFHRGVNIIRGQNSSGKSTIANFIFFSLGGDYNNWTTEALKCRDVFVEIEINGAIITLKRHIKAGGMQPMSFYWATYEDAKNDNINWQTFSYKQNPTNNTVSFTNVLFNALSFPEVKSDTDSSITVHQILRLLYIDQDTPTQSLFRFERFDLPLTRQAISEVLLGVYDDNLYDLRLSYRNANKLYDDKKREFDAINRIYGQAGTTTNTIVLKKKIENEQNELAKTNKDILELKTLALVKMTKRTPLRFEKIQTELIHIKNKVNHLSTEINRYEIEIADSKQFITTLEKRVEELNNSLLTRKTLGEIPLTHCPECLSQLDINVEEGCCHLCKQPLTEEAEKANAKRLKQEMELQIRESRSLLANKERRITELNVELPGDLEKVRGLQKELNSQVENSQTTRDDRIDVLLIQKGGIEKNIEVLTQQMKSLELLELLKKEIYEISAYIEHIKLEIQQKEEQQRNNFQTALNVINDITLYLLKNDLDRQEEFRNGTKVEINFLKDTFSLDGNNNFSASSKTYFKNAVLFSIFLSSLELDFFRYPRLIICDNMEDKGMEKERAQNFQNLVTNISESIATEHQIIFTTSMIAEELNNTPYCVGDYYTRENKTLKV